MSLDKMLKENMQREQNATGQMPCRTVTISPSLSLSCTLALRPTWVLCMNWMPMIPACQTMLQPVLFSWSLINAVVCSKRVITTYNLIPCVSKYSNKPIHVVVWPGKYALKWVKMWAGYLYTCEQQGCYSLALVLILTMKLKSLALDSESCPC